MTDKLREAVQQAVAILGPEAPLCSGCVEEWAEALRILNEALAEQPAEQCWKCGDLDPAGHAKCNVPACGMREDTQPAKREPLTTEEKVEIQVQAFGPEN